MSEQGKSHQPVRPGNLKWIGLAAAVAAALIVIAGISIRHKNEHDLERVVAQQAQPTVKVVRATSAGGTAELILPGTLQAWYSANVYARVPGYLKKWHVDIGDRVKAGQPLGTIETPELDQQLLQAEANLETAQANVKLSEVTAKRWQNLLKSDSVSAQETDEKVGDFEAKRALVNAARADVDRLRALARFKQIEAPFDGIVTARNTDIGALINAGHDAGHALFTVDDVHKLRLYVDIPQVYSNQIGTGMQALLDIPEQPGKQFNARLTGNSRAVKTASGTMQVELEVDNRDGSLLPGAYGNVHFTLPQPASLVRIPVTALVFRKDGMTVATLTADNRVQYRSIQISRDDGRFVDVLAGVAASDRIIDMPPDSLENNDQVKPAQETDK